MIASLCLLRTFVCLSCRERADGTVGILSKFDLPGQFKKAFAVCLAQVVRIAF